MADPAARERLARVLTVLGWAGRNAVALPSHSNDAWRVGDVVLRICYRGDVNRFERGRLVLEELPASIRAPQVLDHGEVGELTWQLSGWLDGTPLALAWPGLRPADRKRAVSQLGGMLADLHGHRFSTPLLDAISGPRPVGVFTAVAVTGADLNPLPVSRARLLLEPASLLPGVDGTLIRRVEELFDELEPADPLAPEMLAPRGAGLIVHGDAHPMNVLWDDEVVALLDWEWVRLGPPELELEPFLHRGSSTDAPSLAQSGQVLGWLAAAHPAAFAHPDLVLRVWLIELAHTLRHLLLWPPEGPAHELPDDHPLRRLRRIVRGPEHLRAVLPVVG